MSDHDILFWIQNFGSGFRHCEGVFYFDWLLKDGTTKTTKGCNIKDAVIGAKLERDSLYS